MTFSPAPSPSAELLVSGDKLHLPVLNAYQGIPIRTGLEELGGLTASSSQT